MASLVTEILQTPDGKKKNCQFSQMVQNALGQ